MSSFTSRWPQARSTLKLSTTTTIIGVNALMWVAILVSGGVASKLTQWLALTPVGTCWVLGQPGSYLPGASQGACVIQPGLSWTPGVATGAYWQVLSSAFVHVSFYHIAFNMMALFFIGAQVERVVGRRLYLGVFAVSALAGSACVLWLSSPVSMTLGASGAVFGLMGVLLVIVWRNRGDVRSVLVWLGLNVAYTFLAGHSISWQGHLGGLVGGALAGFVIVFAPRVDRQRWQWAGLSAIAVTAVVLIVIRVIQLR